MVTHASSGKSRPKSSSGAKKPTAKKKSASPAKPKAHAKPKLAAKSRAKPQKAKPFSASQEVIEAVREELAAARIELARLALAETVAKRARDEHSAERDHLREELAAVRVDLKTALADLEIARTECARADARTHAALVEAAQAQESQRRAEHVSDHVREQLFEAQRALDAPEPDAATDGGESAPPGATAPDTGPTNA